jgi:fatty acid desaturase
MSAEDPVPAEVPRSQGWRAWLRVLAAACALLLLSEALWLWQSWPVRELLRPTPSTAARR